MGVKRGVGGIFLATFTSLGSQVATGVDRGDEKNGRDGEDEGDGEAGEDRGKTGAVGVTGSDAANAGDPGLVVAWQVATCSCSLVLDDNFSGHRRHANASSLAFCLAALSCISCASQACCCSNYCSSKRFCGSRRCCSRCSLSSLLCSCTRR